MMVDDEKLTKQKNIKENKNEEEDFESMVVRLAKNEDKTIDIYWKK